LCLQVSRNERLPAIQQQKAKTGCGTLLNLSADSAEFRFTAVVAPPERSLFSAYDNACKLLDDMEQTREVVPEDEVERVDSEILAADLS
jgi:hypothetical protein